MIFTFFVLYFQNFVLRGQNQKLEIHPLDRVISRSTLYYIKVPIENQLKSVDKGSILNINFSQTLISHSNGNLETCYQENDNTGTQIQFPDCKCENKVCIIPLPISYKAGEIIHIKFGKLKNPPFALNQTLIGSLNLANGSKYENTYTIYDTDFEAEKFEFINLSQSNYIVYNPANYSFKFNPLLDIPNDAILKIVFPSEIVLQSSYQTGLTLYENPIASISHETPILNNSLQYKNAFKSGLKIEKSKTINLVISNILNVKGVKKSSFFSIMILTKDYFLITENSNSIKAESKIPGRILVEQSLTGVYSSNPKDINKETIFSFYFKPEISYTDNGKVEIIFPEEFKFNDGNFRCEMTAGMATFIGNNYNCEKNGNIISTKNLYYPNSQNFILLSIFGVINPPSTKKTGFFNFRTLDSKSALISQNNNAFSFISLPGKIFIDKFTRGDSYLQNSTILDFQFRNENEFPSSSLIKIKFPIQQAILKSTLSCQKIMNSIISNLQCSSVQNSTTESIIKIDEWCSNENNQCTKNFNFSLRISSGYINPPFISTTFPSIEISIDRKDEQGSYDKISDGIIMKPDLLFTSLSNLDITKANTNIAGEQSSIDFQFSANEYFLSVNGNSKIIFPDESILPPKNGQGSIECFLIDANNNEIKKNYQLFYSPISLSSIKFIKSIVISDMCVSPKCLNSIYKLRIKNFRNSLWEESLKSENDKNFLGAEILDENKYLISRAIYPSNKFFSIIKKIFNPTPVIKMSSEINGEISNYEFQFLSVLEIPKNGKIQISFSKGFILNSDSVCSFSGKSSSNVIENLQCTVIFSEYLISIVQLNLDPAFFISAECKISIIKVKNPDSLKPFQGTSISTIYNQKYIEYSDISIQTKIPNSLSTSVNRNNNEVSHNVELTIEIKPYNVIPDNGFLRIEIPFDQLQFVDNLKPNIQLVRKNPKESSEIIIPLIENLNSESFQILFQIKSGVCPCNSQNKLIYVMKNGKNPSSTALPKLSFKVFSMTIDKFLIDSVEKDVFASPNLSSGPLSISTLTSSNRISGEITNINFVFSTTTSTPTNGKILITFPLDLFFSSSNIACQFNTDNAQKPQCTEKIEKGALGDYIKSIEISNICPSSCASNSNLDFTISNLQNAPLPISISKTISIDTFDSKSNSINTGSIQISNVIVQTSGSIKSATAIRNDSTVSSVIFLEIEFESNNIYPKDTQIEILLPINQITLSSDVVCKPYVGNLLSPNSVTCFYRNLNSTYNTITFTEFCSESKSFCQRNSKMKIRLEKGTNPSFVNTEISKIQIRIYTSSLVYDIEAFKNNLFLLPNLKPSNFMNLEISKSSEIVSEEIILRIYLQLSTEHSLKSKFSVEFPLNIFRLSSNQCFITSGNIKSTENCIFKKKSSSEFIDSIDIPNFCNDSTCKANSIFILEFSVKNFEYEVKLIGNINLMTKTNSNYFISSQQIDVSGFSNFIRATLFPNDCELKRSNIIKGEASDFTISFSIPTEIKEKEIIEIEIPDKEINLQNLVKDCIILLPKPQISLKCQFLYSNNLYKLLITQLFCSQKCVKGTKFSLFISKIHNPNKIISNGSKSISISGKNSQNFLFSSKGNLLFLPLIQFGIFTVHKINRSSKNLAETTNFQFNFSANFNILSDYRLFINFPNELIYIDSNPKIIQVSQSNRELISSFSFENDKEGNKFISNVQINKICNPNCPLSSFILLELKGCKNPKFYSVYSQFILFELTYSSNEIIGIDSFSSDLIVPNLVPTKMDSQLIRSSDKITVPISIVIDISTTLVYSKDTRINLKIPKVHANNYKTLPIIYSNGNFQSFLYTVNNDSMVFDFHSNCKSFCSSNSKLKFTITSLKNPELIVRNSQENSLDIYSYEEKNKILERRNTDLFLQPSLAIKALSNVKLTRNNDFAGSTTIFTLIFTFSESINLESYASIKIPINLLHGPDGNNCQIKIKNILRNFQCQYFLTENFLTDIKFPLICDNNDDRCQLNSQIELIFNAINQKNTHDYRSEDVLVKISTVKENADLALGSYNSKLLPSIQPGIVNMKRLTSDNLKVNAKNVKITLEFTMNIGLANSESNGRLEITIPIEFQTGKTYSCKATSQDIPNLNFNCVGSQKLMIITHSNSGRPRFFLVEIFPFDNFGSNKPSSTFIIVAYENIEKAENKINEKNNNLFYIASTLGKITEIIIKRNTSILSSNSIFTFDFKISNEIPKNGKIFIEIQNSYQADFSDEELLCSSSKSTISCTKKSTGIMIQNLCPILCQSNSKFSISVTKGLKNVAYIVSPLLPSNSFSIISFEPEEVYKIDEEIQSLTASPGLISKTLEILNVKRDPSTVSSEMNWEISFKAGIRFEKDKGNLIIDMPEKLSTKSRFKKILSKNSQNTSEPIVSFQNSFLSKIEIPNICLNTICGENQVFSIILEGFQNINFVYTPTQFMNFTLFVQDHRGNFRNSMENSILASSVLNSLSPASIDNFQIINSNPLAGQNNILRFSFSIMNIIPDNSILIIDFPNGIVLDPKSLSKEICRNIDGFSDPINCKTTNKSLVVLNGLGKSSFNYVFDFKDFVNPIKTSNYTGFNGSVLNNDGFKVASFTSESSKIEIIQNTNTSNCEDGCEECSNIILSFCFKCRSIKPFIINGKCLDTCPKNYFFNGKYCLPCHSKCSQCYNGNSSSCIECTNNLKFLDGECVSSCPYNTLSEQGKCFNQNPNACNSSCKTCGLSPNSCLSCNQGFIYDPVTRKCLASSEKCSDGYFSSANSCKKCSEKCYKCELNSNNCSKCSEAFNKSYLNNEICVDECPTNKYFDENLKCLDCHASCEKCKAGNENSCLSCNKGSLKPYFSYSKCIEKCPEGYLIDSKNLSCRMNCSNKNCYSCDSKNNSLCIDCSGDKSILLNSNCYSANNCPLEYFYSNGKCEKCSSNCLYCVSSRDNCTKCNESSNISFLYDSKCISQCPVGYNPDYLDSKICKNFNCSKPCSKCGGRENFCYTCANENPFLYNGSCFSNSCPEGTFNNGSLKESSKICFKCSEKCSVCSNFTNCSSCTGKSVFYQNTCLDNCPSGFVNENRVCYDENILGEYPAQAIFLIVMIFIAIITTFIIEIAKKKISSILIFSLLFSPILLICELLISIEFWKLNENFISSLFIGIIVTNSISGLIFAYVFLDVLANKRDAFKEFKQKNSFVYYMISILTSIFGIFFSDIYRLNIKIVQNLKLLNFRLFSEFTFKFKFIYIFSNCIALLLDIIILNKYPFRKVVFHLSYINIIIQGFIIIPFIIDRVKIKSREKLL